MQFAINHIYDSDRQKQSSDNPINGPDAFTKWLPALSNKWGRLAQGKFMGVKPTDTINFIPFHQVPEDKK